MSARTAHPTTTDGVWRVMRFEAAGGKWAEVASNHIGPEAVNLPAGYRFVRSTPMVAAEQQREALEEIIANLSVPSHPGGVGRERPQGRARTPRSTTQRLRGSGTVNPGCPSMHEPRGGPVRDETVTTRRTEEALAETERARDRLATMAERLLDEREDARRQRRSREGATEAGRDSPQHAHTEQASRPPQPRVDRLRMQVVSARAVVRER
jgi:hypothetical protein